MRVRGNGRREGGDGLGLGSAVLAGRLYLACRSSFEVGWRCPYLGVRVRVDFVAKVIYALLRSVCCFRVYFLFR